MRIDCAASPQRRNARCLKTFVGRIKEANAADTSLGCLSLSYGKRTQKTAPGRCVPEGRTVGVKLDSTDYTQLGLSRCLMSRRLCRATPADQQSGRYARGLLCGVGLRLVGARDARATTKALTNHYFEVESASSQRFMKGSGSSTRA